MAKNKPPANAVCDTGPIIHLDELDSLPLLADFRLWLPNAVWQELNLHRPSVITWLKDQCQKETIVEPTPSGLLALGRALSLNKGEIEALSLMPQVPEPIFLTDDAGARLAAQQLGYRVHGTIGLLLRAIRRRQLPPRDVIDRLRSIPHNSSLFIRSSLLEEIIQRVQEDFKQIF